MNPIFSYILRRLLPPSLPPSPHVMAASKLIQAIDKGGIPLNPIKVNQIARDLGLEVSVSAPMSETIERIRQVLCHNSS